MVTLPRTVSGSSGILPSAQTTSIDCPFEMHVTLSLPLHAACHRPNPDLLLSSTDDLRIPELQDLPVSAPPLPLPGFPSARQKSPFPPQSRPLLPIRSPLSHFHSVRRLKCRPSLPSSIQVLECLQPTQAVPHIENFIQ